MNYIGIINDIPNGYTYRTALTTTKERAQKLAREFVSRKNIDYADISIITVNPM